jgi:hypothetical protein
MKPIVKKNVQHNLKILKKYVVMNISFRQYSKISHPSAMLSENLGN